MTCRSVVCTDLDVSLLMVAIQILDTNCHFADDATFAYRPMHFVLSTGAVSVPTQRCGKWLLRKGDSNVCTIVHCTICTPYVPVIGKSIHVGNWDGQRSCDR